MARPETPRWLQVVGASQAGKTTLMVALVQRARSAGQSAAAVKWSHHPLGGEPAGQAVPRRPAARHQKDAERLHAAGADPVYRVAPDGVERLSADWARRSALPHEQADRWPHLARAWQGLSVEWLLVEGGRELPTPKIVLAPGGVPPTRGPVALWVGRPDDAQAFGAERWVPWAPPDALAELVWARRGDLSRPLSCLAGDSACCRDGPL